MIQNNQTPKDNGIVEKKAASARKGFAGVFLFYFLVAFEFAYMAGPFAIYFYSLYSPVLNFFNNIPGLNWLIQFFLPHAARQTASPFLKGLEVLGIILTAAGLLVFALGAVQIYYSKLAKKGAVMGGLYKYVRHPQYSVFIVSSFGMMLLWPRFIVVILFVTLLFAYRALAKAEERECEERFGAAYREYKQKTGRFLPMVIPKERGTKSGIGRSLLKGLGAYVLTLAVFLSAAFGLRALSINSLYAVYSPNSATIALCKMDDRLIDQVIAIAKADEQVRAYFADNEPERLELNYVLPAQWYAAEVPMNDVVYRRGHQSPEDYDPTRYKVIFTEPVVRNGKITEGKDILSKTLYRTPIVEVWVDVEKNQVIEVKPIPQNYRYEEVPVALF